VEISLSNRVALIGIGNILFLDEGLGIYLIEYIKANFKIPPNLTILDGSGLGFSLMTYFEEYDYVILVGTTSSTKAKTGEIFIYSADDILTQGTVKKTATEAELTMMLEICALNDYRAEIKFISMVPKNIIDVKNGLTPQVLEAMPNLLDRVLGELKRRDIKLTPNRNIIAFEEVIEKITNPKNRK
jgi:hydrogenase maturation protease